VDIKGWAPFVKEARATDGFPATDIWYNYGAVAEKALAAGNNG
jgi:hypothetical protein